MFLSALISIFIILGILFLQKKNLIGPFPVPKIVRRDLWGLRGFVLVNLQLKLAVIQNSTIPSKFKSLVTKHPQKVAFFFEGETWTYSQVESYSNAIARYFKNQGFKRGDSIALLLDNRPEYPSIWLGLSKIGVVTALINTNLVNDPLYHCITAAKCKSIICGTNYATSFKNVSDRLNFSMFYEFCDQNQNGGQCLFPNAINLREEVGRTLDDPLGIDESVKIYTTDPLLYIYTSGTTGLPKAAVITHLRYMFAAIGLNAMAGIYENDIMYICLPFYHSSGGMLGLGQVLLGGITIAIRRKFSATNYWKDCNRYKCTIAQYIGEICRYLLATHYPEPIKHNVRAITGNGLRMQIWKQFVDRFNIKEVYEFYGSTEGITNMINVDNTVGSVGFIPKYARVLYPVTLVKCNEANGEPIRDQNGLCMKCEDNEPGLLIGKIEENKSILSFKGYADKKDTEKKILHDVFVNGDAYFNSGDILMSDESGNFFFRDRTGDTFRWKGENVSTTEVEAVISNLMQLNDALVYGVEIPGTEGRAGMVALVAPNLDINNIATLLANNLPSYSMPLFLRLMESVPMTGSYKLKKYELQLEGYNVNVVKDKLFFYDAQLRKYVELTKDLHDQIMNRIVRV